MAWRGLEATTEVVQAPLKGSEHRYRSTGAAEYELLQSQASTECWEICIKISINQGDITHS